MNDFTKTELNEIRRCLKYMIKGDVAPYSCLTISLNKKIRLMIENYDAPLIPIVNPNKSWGPGK